MIYIQYIVLSIQFNVVINLLFKRKLEKYIGVDRIYPSKILICSIFFGHIMYLFYKKRIKEYVRLYEMYRDYKYYKLLYGGIYLHKGKKEYDEYIKLDRYFKLKRLKNNGKIEKGFFRFDI